MKNLISASLLAADHTCLIQELKRLEAAGIPLVHFDVMDGKFVPNTSFHDATFDEIRKHSPLPFEVHLMVDHPEAYIGNYPYDSGDVIIVHVEGFPDTAAAKSCLLAIREHHRAGISLKPGTPLEAIYDLLPYVDYVLVMSVEPGFGGQKFMPSSLERIRTLASWRKDKGFLIEVDGGINAETGPLCVSVGADILVSGSYLFHEDMRARAEAIRCER